MVLYLWMCITDCNQVQCLICKDPFYITYLWMHLNYVISNYVAVTNQAIAFAFALQGRRKRGANFGRIRIINARTYLQPHYGNGVFRQIFEWHRFINHVEHVVTLVSLFEERFNFFKNILTKFLANYLKNFLICNLLTLNDASFLVN